MSDNYYENESFDEFDPCFNSQDTLGSLCAHMHGLDLIQPSSSAKNSIDFFQVLEKKINEKMDEKLQSFDEMKKQVQAMKKKMYLMENELKAMQNAMDSMGEKHQDENLRAKPIPSHEHHPWAKMTKTQLKKKKVAELRNLLLGNGFAVKDENNRYFKKEVLQKMVISFLFP